MTDTIMMDTALLKPLAEDEPASATSLKRKASAEPNSPRPESLKRARRDSSPEPPQAAAPVSDGDDQSNVMEDEPSGDAKPGAPATAVVQKQEPSSEPAHRVDAYSNTAEEKPQGDTATAPYSPSRRSTSPSRDRDQDRPRQDSNAARERKERFEKEEKKRGQRLFGNILGTLSRRDTSETHKKRLEIDRRQQERLRQQREEADRARAEKKAKLREVRLREQIVWEEEVMRAKHASWREGAGFLRTRTSPGIYYKPWTLTKEQEEDVLRQKDDVELDIQRDLEKFETRREDHIQKYGAPAFQKYLAPASIAEEPQPHEHAPVPEDEEPERDESRAETTEKNPDVAMTEGVEERRSPSPLTPRKEKEEEEGEKANDDATGHHSHQHHQHDESGDVVDETGEDVVIY